MKETKWILKSTANPKTVNELIETLLEQRLDGVSDKNDFLNPPHPNDFIKKNDEFIKVAEKAKLAVDILQEAIANNKKIVIYGDYDVDGITSTAIIWRTIYHDLKYKNVEPFIPNRFHDGYGLSKKVIETLAETGCDLILTVDCGIISVDEVDFAKKLGIKVIISDHHLPENTLPRAEAVVHSTNATGAGIAWIIANEIRIRNNIYSETPILGFASMGTIADLQPLIGFNRSIVFHGLKNLNQHPPIGIKELNKLAGIDNIKLDTYHIGWQIGPRLNATGRLNSAIDSLRLLCTDSNTQTVKLAKEINELNKARQTQTMDGCNKAIEEINRNNVPSFIITASENYHDGIIGLIAGRLTQSFNRPSIAIAINRAENTAKGSARSTKQINLIEILRKHKDLFIKLGGHTMAAGFSIDIENIEKLKAILNNELKDFQFTKELEIDTTLGVNLITKETVDAINKLKPFGVGNNSPVFTTKDFSIFNLSIFGSENNHIKLYLEKENKKITAVGFGLANKYQNLKINQKIDVAYQLVINNWNDQQMVELRLKDIHFKKSKARKGI